MNSHNDCPMTYERFVRRAFSYALGRSVGRSEDPARLAETDSFNENNIAAVKAATIYSIKIITTAVLENNSDALGEDEYELLSSFSDRAMRAQGLSEICHIIIEFNQRVIDRYFSTNNGDMSLR